MRDEKVKVLRVAPRRSRRGRRQAGGARPVRRRRRRRRSTCPATARSRASAQDSTAETFVAIKLFIDNWRWAGVPFYLRAGKRMPKRVTEIADPLQARAARAVLHQARGRLPTSRTCWRCASSRTRASRCKFFSKVPGPTMDVLPVTMDFRYGTSFGAEPPEAYERLMLDCMLGDATLFTRGDEVEASLDAGSTASRRPGRTASQARSSRTTRPAPGAPRRPTLIEADGRAWRRPMTRATSAACATFEFERGDCHRGAARRASRPSWRRCGAGRRPSAGDAPRRSRAPACGTFIARAAATQHFGDAKKLIDDICAAAAGAPIVCALGALRARGGLRHAWVEANWRGARVTARPAAPTR